jgi:hypothetical protein
VKNEATTAMGSSDSARTGQASLSTPACQVFWQASRRQARRAARWWSDILLAAKQHITGRDHQVGTRAEADRATSTLRSSSRKMQATFLHYDWLSRRVASCQSGCASPDRAQRRRTERSAATMPTSCSLTLRPAAQSKCPTAQPSTAELLRGRRSTPATRSTAGAHRAAFADGTVFIREADKAGYARLG